MLMSPDTGASAAAPDGLPIHIFPSVRADPTGDIPAIRVLLAEVSLPCPSTVNVQTWVPSPYVPGLTVVFVSVSPPVLSIVACPLTETEFH